MDFEVLGEEGSYIEHEEIGEKLEESGNATATQARTKETKSGWVGLKKGLHAL